MLYSVRVVAVALYSVCLVAVASCSVRVVVVALRSVCNKNSGNSKKHESGGQFTCEADSK